MGKTKLTPKQAVFVKEYAYYDKYIYIMRSAGYHKIGIANNPKERQIQIQTSNPLPVELVFSEKVMNTGMVEKRLHYFLRDFRQMGEWFSLDDAIIGALISDIKRYKDRCDGYFQAKQST